jgi:hypothetical protein
MKWTLPNCPVHIARHPFPSRQLHIDIWSSYQVHFTLWTAQMKLQSCPRKHFRFWAIQGLNIFFLVCQNFCLKKSDCPWFLFCLDPLSSLSLSLFFVWIYSSLRLERSPFKIQMTLWIIFWTYWEQIERFQLQISCFLCIHLYEWWMMSLKPSYWNGSSSMKIYEILGWNKVHHKINKV